MNETEYNELYQLIENELISNEMAWIVEQTRKTIRIGKICEEKLPNTRKKKPVILSKNYTAKERLFLLVSAVEKAISDLTEFEREVINFFLIEGEKLQISQDINFDSDDFENESSYQLRLKTIDDNIRSFNIVKHFIDELKFEMDKV